MRRSPLRIAATFLLAAGVVTCSDSPTAPARHGGHARLDLAPQLSPDAQRGLSAAAALAPAIAQVHVLIQRPPSTALVDTVVVFPAGQDTLVLDLSVQLQAQTEQLLATVELKDATGQVIYSGTSTITAIQGTTTPPTPTPISVAYVGLGASARTMRVVPLDTTILVGQGVQFSANVFDVNGAPVSNLPIGWSAANTSVASIDTHGAVGGLRPGTTTITATGLNGITASATLHVVNPPASLQVVSGSGQTGPVIRALPQPLVVRVLAADGSGVPGVGVSFSAPSGGTVPSIVTTDSTGRASATATLGLKTGTYTFQASYAGLTPVSFTETATAGAPTVLKLVSGNQQSDTAGKTLAQPLVVQATDSLGNAAAGATVTWTRLAGGGAGSAATSTTDANGSTSITYTLGPATSHDTVRAQLSGLTGPTATVLFALTARPRAPSALTIVSGDAQSVVAGGALAQPLVVQAKDDKGNPVVGARIDWKLVKGTGTLAAAQTTTDSTGHTQTTFTTSTKAGVDSIVAQIDSTGIGVAFAATALPGAPALIAKVAGDNQSATVSTSVSTPPAVRVTDANGNAIASVGVTFAVASGGGSVTGGSTQTDPTGLATVGSWKLGPTPGPNVLSATVGSIGTTFSATALTSATRVASMTLSVHNDTLTSLGDTYALTATAHDSLGHVVADTLTWTSRGPGVAAVNAGGTVTALANGSAWVIVADNSGHTDSARVVVQQRVASVQLTPATHNIYLTRNYHFTAAAVDGRGNAIAGSPAFTWASRGTAVATVDTTGRVTGVGLGSVQVTATTGGVTGTANINVLTPITRIVVGRDSSGVPVSDTSSLKALGFRRTYRAVAHDTLDAVMTGVTFNWTSTNGSVAGLDSITATTARATSAANGLTSIQATAQGVTGSAALNVQQVMTAIQLTPTTVAIAPTGSTGLLARGVDANSRFISGGTFTYVSSDTTIAKVGSTTGIVTGVAAGVANITAKSGVITSNNAQVTISAQVPAKISFGRDTLSVGRGSNASIPILLTAPSAQNVVVKLVVRDTFAYFNPLTVTIPAGQTSVNATLVGHNAGTTKVFATDSSGTGYAADSATLAVQANIHLANNQYYLNATDQYATQVLLSDPSPAGGTYVTFSYSTAGVAAMSPDPAFIPQGQLAANVVVRGLAQGTTNITPSAIGVNGTASGAYVYPADLKFSNTFLRLGQGQYDGGEYVYAPTNNQTSVPITLSSSDTTKVQVTSPITIPGGSNYAYFTTVASGIGQVTVNLSATGWNQANTYTVVSTTPHVGVCCGTTWNTTTPTQGYNVYAEDSTKNGHYRVNSLVVHVRSSDTTVLKVLDTVVTIAPGQYYNNSGRIQPGGSGGTAWLIVTAGGHTPDSTQYTVVGPHLSFATHSGVVGVGQHEPGWYISTPDAVKTALTIHFTNSDSTKVGTPDSVVIAAGQNYVYFDVRAKSAGSIKLVANATGYQADSATFVATTPRVLISGGGTFNNFHPPLGFTVYSADSLRNGHYRMTALPVTLHSTDTNVVRISGPDTIQAGAYYSQTAQIVVVGEGGAAVYATVAGHTTDTVYYNIVRPRVSLNYRFYHIGVRQQRSSQDFDVGIPDARAVPVGVTLTNRNPALLRMSTANDTIAANNYSANFWFAALAKGVDTIISSAPNYVSDTMVVVVTTPHLVVDNIPASGTTTTPPFAHWVYAADSAGWFHYTSDTVVVHVVSSDTTVLKPRHAYTRIVKYDYRLLDTTDIVGPGAAYLTYSDSAGSGYVGASTNTMSVTGPSLSLSFGSTMLGMRQKTGQYVNTQYNVSSPLTVHLLSTSTRVATVPDSVVIPAGTNVAYFDVAAQDTIGTIQVQATATGYTATNATVQVTAPHFVISTNTNARTTQGRQPLTIYATDANGTAHYTTEAVTLTLGSSAGSVASIDSSTVTIAAGGYYTNTASWYPGVVGSSQITASDARSAYYRYNTGAANVSVYTPTLGFSWGTQYLGIGQYVDQYVSTPDNMTSPTSVALSHTGTAFSTLSTSSPVIPSGQNYVYFRSTGASTGSDTVVATLASPQHNPGRAVTIVGLGRIDPIGNWPSSLKAGDSVQVTLYARAPDQSGRYVADTTTWTLSPNANIQFVSGSVPITSVSIPAGAYYVQFYLKAVSAGTGSASITSANYQSYSNTVTVNP